ncbi:hypothetical protein [Marinobacter sp. AL4B]|uniref:hypothetical protein n=1 Tax=Marinobacter sp. AL4B TaxID=2871173 RepID=UPI001CAA695D|nr:hypothetical protein [Marinobacter sp. AL4B]MBZ0333191.1 hypothetical protein [Marinobacter sp. AL4B]
MIYSVLFFFFFGVAFLLPNHYYPWGSFYLEFSAFLALLVALLERVRNIKSISVPYVFFVFLLFSLIPIGQWVAGLILFKGDALLALFYIFGFFLALTIADSHNKSIGCKKYVDGVALALVLIGGGGHLDCYHSMVIFVVQYMGP